MINKRVTVLQGLESIPLANTAAGLIAFKVDSQNSWNSVIRSGWLKMLRCKSEIYEHI